MHRTHSANKHGANKHGANKHGDSYYGPLADPAGDAGHLDHPARVGFFTDTSVCIGCKACEVACKEWNNVPEDGLNLLGMSFDNTGMLGADSWRHVAFVEQSAQPDRHEHRSQEQLGGAVDLGLPSAELPGRTPGEHHRTDFRWLMASDVCKHCTHAGCLDVCPTGALFRTEFGTVVVQQDICNGCGYCVSGCPYGVIERREGDGRANKCTLCYDRLHGGLEPACAKACPTKSIQFGPLDELRERAAQRLDQLHDAGVSQARLYGHDPNDGVGGDGAFFLLLDEPETYGLPPDPVVPTRNLATTWKYTGLAAAAMAAAAISAFAGRRRP
jgi:formate dehydrogenase iron-sulfur subunit